MIQYGKINVKIYKIWYNILYNIVSVKKYTSSESRYPLAKIIIFLEYEI